MAAQPVARVGDTCTLGCSVHGTVSGTFFEGTALGKANNINIVLIGHRGTASCGHTFRAITGSTIFKINNIAVSRVGDQVQFIDTSGTGTIVSGSPTITSN